MSFREWVTLYVGVLIIILVIVGSIAHLLHGAKEDDGPET